MVLDSQEKLESESILMSLITRIISLCNSMDLDSQPKPESKLMSLITQTLSVFNSMDLDSQPKPLSELISLISQNISLDDPMEPEPESKLRSLITHIVSLNHPWGSIISFIADRIYISDSPEPDSEEEEPDSEFMSLIIQTLSLKPETELISLIYQILYLISMEEGKLHVDEEVLLEKIRLTRIERATHTLCPLCNGESHQEHNSPSPVEFKHSLHPKHYLQFVSNSESDTRKCYCCNGLLLGDIVYYCSACDYTMDICCVEKNLVFSTNHQKWHEHSLTLFPRDVSLTCNLCGLADSKRDLCFMCPLCDFVVHLGCFNLPSVIRISRHPHRISFTPSFDKGDWSCGVCRRKINNQYGGYSCIENGCLYTAHSICATTVNEWGSTTQSNVWDGIELEGVPEEIEEEVEPFVRISDGVIQHFSHQHHRLRLDENTDDRDYDVNKQCQACIMPMYFGNFYSCMQCDFVLHEECANLSRKIHHPIHPHLLTLVGGYDGVKENLCSACPWICTTGFFYECSKEGCDFKLDVQCATISEPLVHESHMHPLFLTSKPEETRTCSVCKESRHSTTNETFNCLECDFALCFRCATLPRKVMYKHDEHMLTLS